MIRLEWNRGTSYDALSGACVPGRGESVDFLGGGSSLCSWGGRRNCV